SAIKQAMLNASGHIVLPAFLPEAVHSGNTTPRATVLDIGPRLEGTQLDLSALIESLLRQGGRNIYAQVMQPVERVLLTRTLVKPGGHQTRASEVLGLNRATLRHKLRALGLSIDKVVTEDETSDEGNGA